MKTYAFTLSLLAMAFCAQAVEVLPAHDFDVCPQSKNESIAQMQALLLDPGADAQYATPYQRLASWPTTWFIAPAEGRSMDVSDMASTQFCVGLYSDATPNAKASPEYHLFFGYRRYLELSAARYGGEREWSAMMMMAHEFGHLMQYGHGVTFEGEATARVQELQADCIAGFIMDSQLGPKVADPNQYINSLVKEIGYMGDYAIDNPGHHGTPKEREAALKMGFALSKQWREQHAKGQIPKSAAVMRACVEKAK